MIDKNSKWKCYYEFAKFYFAKLYFLSCVEDIDLYFESVADLELKQKLEILSENEIVTQRWNFNLQKHSIGRILPNFAGRFWLRSLFAVSALSEMFT